MPNCERERRPDRRGHGDVHGSGALGSRRCGSRSGTGDAVAAQRATAIASRTYDEDESIKREMGGAVDRAGHYELGAQQRSMTMMVTAM